MYLGLEWILPNGYNLAIRTQCRMIFEFAGPGGEETLL